MKKSKLIALLMTFIFILTACSKSSNEYMFDNIQRLGFDYVLPEGVIYMKNVAISQTENTYEKLHYLDFESGKSTVFCTKPGCTHEDTDDTCWGVYGYMNFYFVAEDKFYYAKDVHHEDSFEIFTELFVSDINRQNEKQIATFKGTSYPDIVHYKDTIYLITIEYQYDDEGSIWTEPTPQRLIAYNLRENETTLDVEIVTGYDTSVSHAYGMYNDTLYYRTNYSDEYIDWSVLDDEETEMFFSQIKKEYISLNTETLEIKRDESFSSLLGLEIEIERPLLIVENILYYETNSILYAYSLDDGENTVIYEGEHYISRMVGDKFLYHVNWEEGEFYIYDPETKESRRAYHPYGGDWRIGTSGGIWSEYGDYLYVNAYSEHEPVGEYEAEWPFIIKVHKDDIYKEEYEAEIVS